MELAVALRAIYLIDFFTWLIECKGFEWITCRLTAFVFYDGSLIVLHPVFKRAGVLRVWAGVTRSANYREVCQ